MSLSTLQGEAHGRVPAPTPAHTGPLQLPLPLLPGPQPIVLSALVLPPARPLAPCRSSSCCPPADTPAHLASLAPQSLCHPPPIFVSPPAYLAPYPSGSLSVHPPLPIQHPCPDPFAPSPPSPSASWYPDPSPSSIPPPPPHPGPSSSPLPGCHGWLTPA